LRPELLPLLLLPLQLLPELLPLQLLPEAKARPARGKSKASKAQKQGQQGLQGQQGAQRVKAFLKPFCSTYVGLKPQKQGLLCISYINGDLKKQ
jgi:hypothetical protein